MGWIPGCPQDPGVYHGPLDPQAVVLHRTYGAWGGDYSVGKQGIFHILLGKAEGRWAQFAPTDVVQWHCNGANFRAFGVEIEGTNDDPLTDWQAARLGDVLRYARDTHGIPIDTCVDPYTTPPASVRVNGTDFRGVICHTSVATDDGSSQHSDLITPADYQRALGTSTAADPPKKGKKLTLIQTHGLQADEIYITDEMTRRRCAKWEVDLYTGLFKAPIQNRPYAAFHALPDVTPADFKYE